MKIDRCNCEGGYFLEESFTHVYLKSYRGKYSKCLLDTYRFII